jgi:hypothetical protein
MPARVSVLWMLPLEVRFREGPGSYVCLATKHLPFTRYLNGGSSGAGMEKAYRGVTLLVLAGCASASASAINPSDDLHCAVVIRTLARNADQLGANATARGGGFMCFRPGTSQR